VNFGIRTQRRSPEGKNIECRITLGEETPLRERREEKKLK
jgi:hypothetical protein